MSGNKAFTAICVIHVFIVSASMLDEATIVLV